MKFGEMLIKDKVISEQELRAALDRQVMFGGKLGTNLVEMGVLKEEYLTNLLSKHLRMASADMKLLVAIPEEVISSISPDVALQYRVVPFKKERKRLHVAMDEGLNLSILDELRFKTGFDVIPYIVSEIRLVYALEKYYGFKRDMRFISIMKGLPEESAGGGAAQEEKVGEPEELKRIKEAFVDIKDKDEIAELLISEGGKVASRTIAFIIKEDHLEGWRSRHVKVDDFSIDIESGSVVGEVIAKKNFHRGPIPSVQGNTTLIALLGGTPQDCVIIPVGIKDRIIALFYADNGNDRVLSGNLTYLNGLAQLASLAFERLILRNRILDFPFSKGTQ
ncbi:MAG: hypothetical protein ACM34I_09145 [bacterium]